MKEKNINKLNDELKFLLKDEREKEIANYSESLSNDNVNIELIANEIYTKRGIDYKLLKKGFFNKMIESFSNFSDTFKNHDSKIRKKMIIDLVYMVVILVLIKLPFDLIRDIGYDYLEVLTRNEIINNLWYLGFLLLYTITFICALIVLINNFNKKYK